MSCDAGNGECRTLAVNFHSDLIQKVYSVKLLIGLVDDDIAGGEQDLLHSFLVVTDKCEINKVKSLFTAYDIDRLALACFHHFALTPNERHCTLHALYVCYALKARAVRYCRVDVCHKHFVLKLGEVAGEYVCGHTPRHKEKHCDSHTCGEDLKTCMSALTECRL